MPPVQMAMVNGQAVMVMVRVRVRIMGGIHGTSAQSQGGTHGDAPGGTHG
jgi:hypothetical protein